MKLAHIYIYGIIDSLQDEGASQWGFVNLKDVKNQIEKQGDFDEIVVHINSEGGDVYEGFGIHDYLTSLGKQITTKIEGLCASIATVIALAGDTREITANSTFMIHNPWGFAGGEKKDLQKYAEELERIENQLAQFYASKTNLTFEQAKELMNNETFFNSQQAIEKGFITKEVEIMKAVALFNPNRNNFKNQNTMTYTKEELDAKFDKQEGFFAQILAKLTGKKEKPKALVLQDANGVEVDFTEVEEDETPQVGDTAQIDGVTVESGSYIFPSWEEKTVVFENGAVTEIIDAQQDSEEVAALKQENEGLNAQIVDLKAQLKTKDALIKETTKDVQNLQKEFSDFKASISSNYQHDEKKNPKGKTANNQSGLKRTPINRKK